MKLDLEKLEELIKAEEEIIRKRMEKLEKLKKARESLDKIPTEDVEKVKKQKEKVEKIQEKLRVEKEKLAEYTQEFIEKHGEEAYELLFGKATIRAGVKRGSGVIVNGVKYSSCAEACRAFGLDVKPNENACRKLESYCKKHGLQFERVE